MHVDDDDDDTFDSILLCSRALSTGPSFATLINVIIFKQRDVIPYPTITGKPPLIGCPRQNSRYIYRYTPYLEAISSILNPRKNHVIAT